jgi:2-(1,2-epoxy-1,2-dihydrophenyl)acetyl-CoA isomerase
MSAAPEGRVVEGLVVERDARGVVTISLDHPARRNAITGAMFAGLRAVFREITERPADRVVVITGRGDAFSSGADLSPAGDPSRERLHTLYTMRNLGEAALALHQVHQPVIAKINGVAVGAGLNLALGCDLIYASDRARFGEIFAKRGLSIDFGGSWLLPRLVGMHKAKELALLAEMFDAHEAARVGIVNRVIAHDELDAYVDDVAGRLAAGPPIALGMTKRLLNEAPDVSLAQALENEAMAQAVNSGTDDTTEAIRAFLDKRTPTFKGR